MPLPSRKLTWSAVKTWSMPASATRPMSDRCSSRRQAPQAPRNAHTDGDHLSSGSQPAAVGHSGHSRITAWWCRWAGPAAAGLRSPSCRGATMACWAATAASRKQRWIGLVRYTAAPPALRYIDAATSAAVWVAWVAANRMLGASARPWTARPASALLPGVVHRAEHQRPRPAEPRLRPRDLSLGSSPLGQGPGAPLGLPPPGQIHQLVDGAAGDAHRGGSHPAGQHPVEGEPGPGVVPDRPAPTDLHPTALGDQRVSSLEIYRAGAGQPGHVPRLDEGDVVGVHEHERSGQPVAPRLRPPVGTDDETATPDGGAVLGARAPLPVSRHPQAAVDGHGPSPWHHESPADRGGITEQAPQREDREGTTPAATSSTRWPRTSRPSRRDRRTPRKPPGSRWPSPVARPDHLARTGGRRPVGRISSTRSMGSVPKLSISSERALIEAPSSRAADSNR